MTSAPRFAVGLYGPRTKTALDALARHLHHAGFRTSLRLPEPGGASKLPHSVLPYGTLVVSLLDGKAPTGEVVETAVIEAVAALKKRFGVAALDLNGKLYGSLPEHS